MLACQKVLQNSCNFKFTVSGVRYIVGAFGKPENIHFQRNFGANQPEIYQNWVENEAVVHTLYVRR